MINQVTTANDVCVNVKLHPPVPYSRETQPIGPCASVVFWKISKPIYSKVHTRRRFEIQMVTHFELLLSILVEYVVSRVFLHELGTHVCTQNVNVVVIFFIDHV